MKFPNSKFSHTENRFEVIWELRGDKTSLRAAVGVNRIGEFGEEYGGAVA